LEALHSDDAPLYQKITYPLFQPIMNELFGRLSGEYEETALKMNKQNKEEKPF